MFLGFDEFQQGDLVIGKEKDGAYCITKVRKCTCPCGKTKWIKRIIIKGWGDNKLYHFSWMGGKREVIRVVK